MDRLMKSARLLGEGHFIDLVEEDVPSLRSGEILVKVRASAICGSDLRILRGKKKATSGVTLGHEISGEVVEMAEKGAGIAIGDRVTIYPCMVCGHCYYCVHGYSNLCVAKKTLGYAMDGGFSEYIRIPATLVERGAVVPLPLPLSYDEGALIEPFSCCLSSLRISQIAKGSRVLIIGSGSMGLMHVLALKGLHGAGIIISDPIVGRRELALRLGAEIAIDPQRGDLKEVVLDYTEGVGVDACIVTVGIPRIIEPCLGIIRKRGILNLFAGGAGPRIGIDPDLVHYGELIITGTHSTTLSQFRETVGVLESNSIPLAELITHRFSLDEIQLAFDVYAKNEGIKVIIHP
jgi:L-iditol 2-dehydrogenase